MKISSIFSTTFIALIALLGWLTPVQSQSTSNISLTGEWRFALDSADTGIREQWFTRDLKDRITLPGILQAQGYGDEISTGTPWVLGRYDRFWYQREEYKAYTKPGKVQTPFLSQPPKHYLGAAWYQRIVDIPRGWSDRRVVLTLERPRWRTTVWVDENQIGSNNSLVAPHVYDLGSLKPGRHRITIRIDNRMIFAYRPDAHNVSDSAGSTWNGIAGAIELTSTTRVWIEDAQVFPNIDKKTARVKVRIGSVTGKPGSGVLTAGGSTTPVKWDETGGAAELEVQLGRNAQLWDEFNPALHRLSVRLDGDDADDTRDLVFGLRQIRADGNQLLVNGRPTLLRGTINSGDFPLTGYPATDVHWWRQIIGLCQSWGLNHMRFHSWCPPEAAFIAADELGFYLQPEAGMWSEIGQGSQTERILYEETERVIRAYGNHPSFLLLSANNEPRGNWKEALTAWVNHFRSEDSRRLYTPATGSSLIDAPGPLSGTDYLDVSRIGQNMLRRESGWFGGDYGQALKGINVPVLTHELGQWAAYPDYDVIDKFRGYMQPGNYKIFRDSLAVHGLIEKNEEFAKASGRFQFECYKEDIEANLRIPGLSGFQMLSLRDYPGEGTAPVGLLDAFWDSKHYATPDEFRRFCNSTVVLARLKQRVLTTSDDFNVEVEIAHFGAAPIENATPVWQIADANGALIAEGEWPARTIPIGKNIPLGRVRIDLSRAPAPRAYRLIIGLKNSLIENDWNFWLYPAHIKSAPERDVLVTTSWSQAKRHLAAGGKVLFLPRSSELDWSNPPLDVVPISWNRQMMPEWSRMLGLYIERRHPALAEFPTDRQFDWQWTEIVRGARAINMDSLPAGLDPIVEPIDDWNRNHKLALVFECTVGRGRLVVCSADLENSLASRPAARQLRTSLLDYMHAAHFRPRASVTSAAIEGLLFDTVIMHALGATAQGTSDTLSAMTVKASDRPTNDAGKAIDGDPNTYWETNERQGRHPHELTLSFRVPRAMSGVVLMPRQNNREHEGDIREFALQISDDGMHWRDVMRGELPSSFEPHRVRFEQPISARFLKLIALSGFGDDTSVSLAELAVIPAGTGPAPRRNRR